MNAIARRILRGIRIAVLNLLDLLVPKRADQWVFPAYFVGRGNFGDNARAVFERVKDDPGIRKIVLQRDAPIDAAGANVHVLPMGSYAAAWALLRSKVVFVQHSMWLDYARCKHQALFHHARRVINLWHGIPLKDISHENTGIHGWRGLREMPHYHLICSSEADRGHMQRAFRRTPPGNLHLTGLPRSDLLLCPEQALPTPYRTDLARLRAALHGRRLVLYAPTYRETQSGGSHYEFSEAELDALASFCARHDYAFGLRYHPYRRPPFLPRLVARGFLDLSTDAFADARVLVRCTEVLVTDYSSVFLDALYANVACLSFAYDYEHYATHQRGFFYSFEALFGHALLRTFPELLEALRAHAATGSTPAAGNTDLARMFFAYRDTGNAERVVRMVRRVVSGRR